MVLKRIKNRLPVCLNEWAGCRPIYFIDALERRPMCSLELCDTWEVPSPLSSHFHIIDPLKTFQDVVTFSFKNSVGQNPVGGGKY